MSFSWHNDALSLYGLRAFFSHIPPLHLGETQGASALHIGGKTWYEGHRKIKVWQDNKIKFKVPAYTGNFPKYKDVWVTVGGIDSNKVTLTVLEP